MMEETIPFPGRRLSSQGNRRESVGGGLFWVLDTPFIPPHDFFSMRPNLPPFFRGRHRRDHSILPPPEVVAGKKWYKISAASALALIDPIPFKSPFIELAHQSTLLRSLCSHRAPPSPGLAADLEAALREEQQRATDLRRRTGASASPAAVLLIAKCDSQGG